MGHKRPQKKMSDANVSEHKATAEGADSPPSKRLQEISKLMHDLRMVANIKEGQKLGTTRGSVHIYPSSSMSTPFWRWVHAENRVDNIDTVRGLVNGLYDHIDVWISERQSLQAQPVAAVRNKQLLSRGVKLLRDVQRSGLHVLSVTYSADPNMQSRIYGLQEEIDSKLEQIMVSLACAEEKKGASPT